MRYFLCLLGLIFLSACGVTWTPRSNGEVVVSVDSYGDINLQGKTYYLVDSKFSQEFPLEVKELIEKIERTLYLNGANRVMNMKSADLIIATSLGISDPISYNVSIPIPIWGPTGVASTTTNSNANIYRLGNSIYGNGSSTTRYNYNYGVTGVYSAERNITQYMRHCNLFIYDNKRQSKSPISKIIIESMGENSDLREIFPYMLSAALPYIGKSIGKKVEHSLALHEETEWLYASQVKPVQFLGSSFRYASVIGTAFYTHTTRVYLRTFLSGSTWIRIHPKTYLVRPNGSTSLLTNTSAILSPKKLWGNGFRNWQVYDFVIDFQPGKFSRGTYQIEDPNGWNFSFKIE